MNIKRDPDELAADQQLVHKVAKAKVLFVECFTVFFEFT